MFISPMKVAAKKKRKIQEVTKKSNTLDCYVACIPYLHLLSCLVNNNRTVCCVARWSQEVRQEIYSVESRRSGFIGTGSSILPIYDGGATYFARKLVYKINDPPE
jgi:hypothetical protein